MEKSEQNYDCDVLLARGDAILNSFRSVVCSAHARGMNIYMDIYFTCNFCQKKNNLPIFKSKYCIYPQKECKTNDFSLFRIYNTTMRSNNTFLLPPSK